MTRTNSPSPGNPSGRHSSRASTPAGRADRSSYEAGESSAAGSFMHASSPSGNDGTTLGIPSPRHSNRSSLTRRRGDDSSNTQELSKADAAGEIKSQRQRKVRSARGFLLQDTLRDAAANDRSRPSRPRQPSNRLKSSPSTSNRSGSSTGHEAGHDAGLGLDLESPPRVSPVSPKARQRDLTIKKRSQEQNGGQNGGQNGPPAEHESTQKSTGRSLDMDSAQIVSMALNLSESRRMASRRNATQAVPPTLAPLPDGTAGGSLRQHLQQQRRTSRNISPRSDRGLSPRLPSGTKMSSPIKASFDVGREGSYSYRFSQSTLSRAQKAKEHIELMAQYRRVLELVPPLKPSARGQSMTGGSPSSGSLSKSSTMNSADGIVQLGRPYDPLQYIRNRKVRARERKGIDGEAQGFGDIKKVTDWVDNVARWAATGQSTMSGGPALPPFADADALAQQAGYSSASMKPKRPRVDWAIDPADMVADVYWLEQDHHLQLIEDRHWRRIFPQTVEPPRPLTGQTEKHTNPSPKSLQKEQQTTEPPGTKMANQRSVKPDADQSHGKARDRARQKLQDLRSMHRHSTSAEGHHDFLRLNKTPPTDLSDSEEDEQTRAKMGLQRTFTHDNKDILEKQMLDMLARESRESNAGGIPSKPPTVSKPLPERQSIAGLQTPPRPRSRKASVTDASDPDEKPGMNKSHSHPAPSHHIPGRPSLDVPISGMRMSLDWDTSVPNSPESHPVGDSPFIPTIGADLSLSPSRSASPTRNPFHKVKNIFRERSRERGSDARSGDKDAEADTATDIKAASTEATITPPPAGRASAERRGSESSTKKGPSRSSMDIQRGTAKPRNEDSGAKGILKGARIDNVIRGGVSRLGDLIWRKESDQTASSQATLTPQSEGEGTLTEDSDTEPRRGRRRRPNLSMSRTNSGLAAQPERSPPKAKHYLDVMPTFQHTSHDRSSAGHSDPVVNPESCKSSRFDLLKPPRIDVQHPSPSLSPPWVKVDRDESDVSEEHSGSGSHNNGVKEADRRLNSVISAAPSYTSGSRKGSVAASFDRRHWSISARSPSPRRAPVSRREIARLRAMALSSGVLAMEIARRAHEPQPVFAGPVALSSSSSSSPVVTDASEKLQTGGLWPSVADLSTDPVAMRSTPVPPSELYQLGAQALSASIRLSGRGWRAVSETFAGETAPALHAEVEAVRRHVAVDLSAMTRAAADDADETSRDLAHPQRLKIKHVVDVIEKMLRSRRRRFRWVRRAMWLGVEWVLVWFMWYVWFVVTISRVFWGVGRGVVGAVRWLFWL